MLAKQLLNQHGLDTFLVKFDNAKRRFGLCRNEKKVISISLPLLNLNDEARVRDVILHEIAHALHYNKYERRSLFLRRSRQVHGETWKEIARSIGCNGLRCYSVVKAQGSLAPVQKPPARFIYQCPECMKISETHRHSNSACGVCCKKYNRGIYSELYRLVLLEDRKKVV